MHMSRHITHRVLAINTIFEEFVYTHCFLRHVSATLQPFPHPFSEGKTSLCFFSSLMLSCFETLNGNDSEGFVNGIESYSKKVPSCIKHLISLINLIFFSNGGNSVKNKNTCAAHANSGHIVGEREGQNSLERRVRIL